jgi:hypothetical protein
VISEDLNDTRLNDPTNSGLLLPILVIESNPVEAILNGLKVGLDLTTWNTGSLL